MIWLYILAAIVAQAIAVVLIIEFIERRGKKSPEVPPADTAVVASLENKTQPTLESEDVSPVKQPVGNDKVAIEDDEAVGRSTFTHEQFKAMMEAMKPILEECIEKALDMREVEFDKSARQESRKEDKPKDDMRMTAEQAEKAWEDHRDEEKLLDSENNDPVPPNPLASGADFEQITAATDTLEHPENHTVHEITVAVKVIHGLNGTEFTGCLPDSLFEKLQQYHRMADRKRAEAAEGNSEEVKEVSRPGEKRAEKEKDVKEPSREFGRRDWSKTMALINDIRQSSQNFRNQ